MDYKVWVDLFGRTGEDPLVKDALKKAGVTKKIVMPRGEIVMMVQIGSMSLTFRDEALFPNLPPVGEGNCVLTGVAMFFDYARVPPYVGPAPYGITKSSSQKELRKQFGRPVEEDEEGEWDTWAIEDGRTMTAAYKEDKNSLKSLAISLSDPD